jgi:hypothetical protein
VISLDDDAPLRGGTPHVMYNLVFDAAGQAVSGSQLIWFVCGHAPDVVIFDIGSNRPH